MKSISELIYLKLLNNLVEMLPEIFDEIVSFSSIRSLTTYVRTSRTTCVFWLLIINHLQLLNNLVEMLPEIFDDIVSFSSICSLTT